MSVQIVFEEPRSFYSNLDIIKGRVVLSLSKDETVSGIFVKLEGESRTALMRPYNNNRQHRERSGYATENHKVLYKVQQVFPTTPISGPGSRGQPYTIGAGKHEYAFRFKIPFNNSCVAHDDYLGIPGGLSGMGLTAMQHMNYKHVKRTLPPSLTGFPGMAEIRYYVKVTVQRPSLFRENRRSAIGFRFLPIEPPRPRPTTNEVFAKRPYAFESAKQKSGGIFSSKKSPGTVPTTPRGEVDARLPSPAVVTCNEPLPLRILVRNTSDSLDQLFLTSLQINLIGSTDIRALDVFRTETVTWPMLTLESLSIPVGTPGDKAQAETILDKKLWDGIPLPNTVAPSFKTCNLARRYELEVRVGLGYGSEWAIQPQTIILPLRFKIEIYSGVSPPAALLNAMASRPAASNQRPQTARPPQPQRPPAAAPAAPYDPAYPPQLTTATAPEDDAPPSYEDAMADDIAPVDGQRREYSGVTDVNAPSMDEKAPRYSAR